MSTTETKKHLLGMARDDLTAYCKQHGLPAYRAKQLCEWVYTKGAHSFDDMTNLAKPLRGELAERWAILTAEVARQQESSDGTTKTLLRWPDGATSECVLIPDGPRRTACISSQVGCPVGCVFCASGLRGLERQLTAGEIVEQLLRVSSPLNHEPDARTTRGSDFQAEDHGQDARATRGSASQTGPHQFIDARDKQDARATAAGRSPGPRGHAPTLPTNVVFMGLGEPLANYQNVLRAVRIINADWGLNIGARRITISTVGLPSQIRRLAREDLQINLAISLHAPTDELRRELIPWARHVTLDALVAAARDYFDTTGREITLEYILLAGINDATGHANDLVRICRKMRCNVNLIRYNPVPGLPFERPTSFATHRFAQQLRSRGVNAHVRKSRGLDIDAACGQLRRGHRSGFSESEPPAEAGAESGGRSGIQPPTSVGGSESRSGRFPEPRTLNTRNGERT